MPSLTNIPEPTNAYRPDDGTPAPQAPLHAISAPPAEPPRPIQQEAQHEGDEPQQQIDSVSCILLLLIAGGLLRAVLGYFGPLKSVDAVAYERLVDQGRLAFSDAPAGAFPVPGLIAQGLSVIGAPSWVLVGLGSLLTLAAAPAAYIIGRAATGRRAAGVLAAALIAVHPAVLTASNSVSGTALALSLVTIGLALSLHASKRGWGFAIGGGLTLALAGLTAPLCWVVAALAGPFAGQVALQHGLRRSLTYGLTVFVLALGPIAAYRYSVLGASSDALLVEFNEIGFAGDNLPPIDRTLIALSDPSLSELGAAMHLPLGDAGKLSANMIGVEPRRAGQPDLVADLLADGWLLMNAALASLATVSVGVMLWRRRLVETAALAAPLLLMGFASVTPGEALRLPMLSLVGVLAAGLLSNRPVARVDEQALAEREAKKTAKLAAKHEKQRARQERDAEKQKNELFAFDKPSRRERKARAKQKKQAEVSSQPAGILTERVADESSIPARPI